VQWCATLTERAFHEELGTDTLSLEAQLLITQSVPEPKSWTVEGYNFSHFGGGKAAFSAEFFPETRVPKIMAL
jgi:hypothetical protein